VPLRSGEHHLQVLHRRRIAHFPVGFATKEDRGPDGRAGSGVVSSAAVIDLILMAYSANVLFAEGGDLQAMTDVDCHRSLVTEDPGTTRGGTVMPR